MKNFDAASDPVEMALLRYVRLRHGGNATHPFDWDRFYRFVVAAHAHRKGWDADDLQTRMIRYGLPKEKAAQMAEIYWHCRCALRVRGRWAKGVDYSAWLKKGGFRLT